MFNTLNVNRYVWDAVQERPTTKSAIDSATRNEIIRIDPRYFGQYHSADEHNFKANLPIKRFVIMGAIVLALLLMVSLLIDFFDPSPDQVDSAPPNAPEPLHPLGPPHRRTTSSCIDPRCPA